MMCLPQKIVEISTLVLGGGVLKSDVLFGL